MGWRVPFCEGVTLLRGTSFRACNSRARAVVCSARIVEFAAFQTIWKWTLWCWDCREVYMHFGHCHLAARWLSLEMSFFFFQFSSSVGALLEICLFFVPKISGECNVFFVCWLCGCIVAKLCLEKKSFAPFTVLLQLSRLRNASAQMAIKVVRCHTYLYVTSLRC